MKHPLLGVFAGAVAGFVVVTLVELVSIWLYPLPPGLDPTNKADMASIVSTMPVGAFLFVLAAWFLGAGIGATVALRVAKGPARWPGLVVGGLVLAGAVYNVWVLPHPAWFVASALVGIVAVTLLVARPRTVEAV